MVALFLWRFIKGCREADELERRIWPIFTSFYLADLAERLAVSRQTINSIKTGKYDPSLPLAMKIARLFALRVEDVFQDEADSR